MKYIILAVVATEAITEILLHSNLFRRPRKFLARAWFFREIFSCGWCLSVWVATVVCITIYTGLWYILLPLLIHRLSNLFHVAYEIVRKIRWLPKWH